ncbi:MAG: hypothetical protein HC822_02300 [Oscillochloris sp.]|nr:hypothetical protein [Oscillochloris sp.]
MRRRNLLWIVLTLLVGCSTAAPGVPSRPGNGPYGLTEPFLSAWERAGGEQVGPPQTAPLWIDDYQVQFFESLAISAIDGRQAVAEPLPEGWAEHYPATLFGATAAAQRATIGLADGDAVIAAPLQPLTLSVRVPGYSGLAEIRLYDATLQPSGMISTTVSDGRAEPLVMPVGHLGPQWAIVLIDGRVAGVRSELFYLEAETSLRSGQADLDALYPRLRGFMNDAAVQYALNGATVRGYRSPDNPLLWLRDHVYQGRGFRYFEPDVRSLLDAFRAAQLPDGSFPDVIDYPDRFVTAFRKEVEADLEFLFIQGVYEAWQISGDDAWLAENLPAMRRAVAYITTDPLRWDAERGLVRRPYTIDMWDFSYGPATLSPDGKPAPRHWIEDDTIFGTFHGDNTGLAAALYLLARAERRVGDPQLADQWDRMAGDIIARLNALSWNGRFYTHFVPEDPNFVPQGVDPARQLSLSNAYALNRRGVLDDRQARRIIETYFKRRDFERAFAEWYSIDPPFPEGSYGMAGRPGDSPGEYVNGGIMPLVGGELARGAFTHGSEPYGFDILRRYAALTELTDASYLWYYPDGRPGISGPDTIGTDGWGASAMIGALFEGAAGVSDLDRAYRDVLLSPRWSADPSFRSVDVVSRYAASDGYVAYNWQREAGSLRLNFTGSATSAAIRLLLPPDAPTSEDAFQVRLNGEPVAWRIVLSGESPYVGLEVASGSGVISVTWEE